MDPLVVIVAIVPTVLIVGAILAPVLSHRLSSPFRDRPLPDGDDSEGARSGNQRQPVPANETEPESEQGHGFPVESGQEDQYHEDWMALQERFFD